jgi:hypothetical protein
MPTRRSIGRKKLATEPPAEAGAAADERRKVIELSL